MRWASNVQVRVICFGQLPERLGWRQKTIEITEPATPLDVALMLDLQMWTQHGLTYHVDGKMVTPESPLSDGCELALLPPVSGG